MVNAILIDDEKNALEVLEWQLKTYCPQVYVAALCTNADEGVTAIKKHNPHLVFLDIEMPKKNGFEVLLALPDPTFEVIFTTAYDEYALKAFEVNALDYLLKPIEPKRLADAVHKLQYEINKERAGLNGVNRGLLTEADQVFVKDG